MGDVSEIQVRSQEASGPRGNQDQLAEVRRWKMERRGS